MTKIIVIISLPSKYSIQFTLNMEDVTNTLVSVNNHEGSTMISGNYYCDKLDFNTGIWRHSDYDKSTKLIRIQDNFYNEAPYLTGG